MGRSYWIIEYLRVAVAYGFTMYVWPNVVFRKHLKKKDVFYRFAFCTLSMVAIVTTVISFLGIFRLISTPFLITLFYGIFIVKLLGYYNPFHEIRRMPGRFQRKTLTPKRMLLDALLYLRDGIKKLAVMIWDAGKGSRVEYALLFIGLVYATVYFSYTPLTVPAFVTSDQYVHHSWAYMLAQNTIYPNGIYPVAMHCMMYVMSCFFGVSLYSVNLFLSVIHVHAVLLGAYLMMKELYSFKYTPMFGLYAFITVGIPSALGVTAMTRLTMTLPQEYGFVAVFLSGYSLLRYMKRANFPVADVPRRRFNFLRSIMEDEDLRLFILAVSYTIMAHYYATIIAFFICIVIFIVYIPRNLQWKRLLSIAAAALLALLLAAAPTGVALAKGYKFQGSIAWALSVSKGEAADENDASDSGDSPETSDEEDGEASDKENEEASDKENDEGSGQENPASRRGLLTRTIDAVIAAPELFKRTVETHEAVTFQALYYGTRGRLLRAVCIAWIVVSLTAMLVLWAADRISGLPGTGRREENTPGGSFFVKKDLSIGKLNMPSFVAYFTIASTFMVFITAFNPAPVGLPILIAGDRLCALIELFAIMTCCCLPDLVFSMIEGKVPEAGLSVASAAACFCIYVGMILSGQYHGFLFSALTRYPAAVEITERIIRNMPKDKFTIVSTTEELYHVIDHGYHEEMIDLVKNRSNKTYTIPTPYIFIYLEKKPLDYGQVLFPRGPKWLAGDYYTRIFRYDSGGCSIYPDYLHGETSAALAAQDLPQVTLRSDYAMELDKREIMESKAMEWYEAFRKAYPYDGTVVYEDDYFLCYCVKQNEFSLFTLGVID